MTPQLIDAAPESKPGPTGPRTEEGKSRSRLNAFRHGLTGQKFVFSTEEAETYAQHSAQIHQHYEPYGPIEAALVRQIADGIWRIDRASAIEHAIFALALTPESQNEEEGLNLALIWLQEGKNLALLTLYVKRIENKLDANKAELSLIQNIRKQEAVQAMNEAIILNRAAAFESKPYQPEDHFHRPPAVKESVFSATLVSIEDARRQAFETAHVTATRAANPRNRPQRDAA